MKILLPNAKELNTNQDNLRAQPLSSPSQALLAVLSQMSVAELATFYKIKEEKAELEADRWQRILSGQAKTYPAWTLYDGLMYRYMKRRDLTEAEEIYLRKHAFIMTGFYGAINVFEPLAPHRLDFQGSLKVEGVGLKNFWRAQYDQLVESDELIVDLLSSEFEAVFSPAIQKRMTKVTFMEDRRGQLKIHSTISKKGRGRLLSMMAENDVTDVAGIKSLTFDGFSYRDDLSSEMELVFVRADE